MSGDDRFTGKFVSTESDAVHFTLEEVARALLVFVPESEANEIASELYRVDPEMSGAWFDENLFTALEMLSPEIADRVARLLKESQHETEERRKRFREMLESNSGGSA